MKTLKVMERAIRSGEPLPISSIFLTTVSKGEFTEALLHRVSHAGRAYHDPLFNFARHEIVLVDDSPAELLDFRRRNSQVYGRYPVVLQTVLSRRAGTKNLAKQAPPTEALYHSPTFDDQFSIGAGNRLRDDVNFALLQAGFENQPGERAFHGVHTFAWTEQYDRQVAEAWEERKRMKRSS